MNKVLAGVRLNETLCIYKGKRAGEKEGYFLFISSFRFLFGCYLRLHVRARRFLLRGWMESDVCGLAVYPRFKASVSLMSLCSKRSSSGLLACSAFQTQALLQHARADRSNVCTSRMESCTVTLVPQH